MVFDPLFILSLLFAIAAFLFALREHIDKLFSTRQTIYEKYSEKILKIQYEFQLFATRKILEFVKEFNIPEKKITDDWVKQEYSKLESKLNEIYNLVQSTSIPRVNLKLFQKSREDIQKRVLKWIAYFVGLGVLVTLILLNISILTTQTEYENGLTFLQFLLGISFYYIIFGGYLFKGTWKEYRTARDAQKKLDGLIEAFEFRKEELLEMMIEYSSEEFE